MTHTFIIPGSLPGLNEYTDANRGHKYGGNSLKKQTEQMIIILAKNQLKTPIKTPVFMTYTWIEPNRFRDKDNIAFAKKFVQDALVKAGKIKGDGWKYVTGFKDDFEVDNKNPRVIVEIEEVGYEREN